MQWLKRFLESDDPVVKLLAAMTEPEAQMRKELLERRGVPAMVKNTGALQSHLQLPFSQDFDLYVKRSDSELAEQILGVLMDTSFSVEDAEAESRGDGGAR